MTLQHLSFNLQLARLAQIGYHKSITAFNLVGAPLIHADASQPSLGRERSASRPKYVNAQLHRANRLENTVQRQRRLERERARNARRREATRQLKQAALALTSES